MTVAVLDGGPTKGPATLLLKFKPGGSIRGVGTPPRKNLTLVSSAGTAQMRDGQPMTMQAGD